MQDGDEPYRRLPRLQANAARPLWRWFEAGLDFEAVRFDHDEFDPFNPGNLLRYDNGDRVDIRPWLRARLGGASWFVVPQLAWRYTRYGSLDGPPVALGADESFTRSVPLVRVGESLWMLSSDMVTELPDQFTLHAPCMYRPLARVFSAGGTTSAPDA